MMSCVSTRTSCSVSSATSGVDAGVGGAGGAAALDVAGAAAADEDSAGAGMLAVVVVVPVVAPGFGGLPTSAWYAHRTPNERKIARRTRLSMLSISTPSAPEPGRIPLRTGGGSGRAGV